ncbi:MAG: FKBP-type peptidyl-prolyl cis-trans isomerase [Planctomycetaceae bacterium]
MTRLTFVLLFACLSTSTFAQDPPTAPGTGEGKAPALKTNRDKVSYAIGLSIGRNLQQRGMQLDPQAIAMGIATILNGTDPVLTQEEIQAASVAFDQEMAKAQQQIAAENKVAADRFLTENAKKEGVRNTKTGMQYIVLQEGSGKTPTAEDTVSTHYRGKLINGTMFDQSYVGDAPTKADMPVSFGVGEVIAGWTEALQMMKVGAKYRLFIPPSLAYGESGRPGIPPNSLLIFDIELVSVK